MSVKTARNRDIFCRVLIKNETIKSAADAHGIAQVTARSALHRLCRKNNKNLYDSLMHANTYADGYVNDGCLPFLSELRDNALSLSFRAACCDYYQTGLDKINNIIALQVVRTGKQVYDGKPFVYCPWCGKKTPTHKLDTFVEGDVDEVVVNGERRTTDEGL